MIRDATKKTVEERKKIDQEANDLVRRGDEQFSFLMETNPQIKDGLTWFQGVIQHWDLESQDQLSRSNRMEHVDAWALQRDVNYAYSDRKRLFDMGHDSRYEEAYTADFRAEVTYTERA